MRTPKVQDGTLVIRIEHQIDKSEFLYIAALTADPSKVKFTNSELLKMVKDYLASRGYTCLEYDPVEPSEALRQAVDKLFDE